MKFFERLEPVWLAIVLVGALNWMFVGVFDTNVLAEVFGTGTLTDVVYAIVGFAAIMMLPTFLGKMHMGGAGHRPAHGAR